MEADQGPATGAVEPARVVDGDLLTLSSSPMTISWRANSREEASHVPGNVWEVAVVGVLMSVYILVHSGWKNRLTFKAVRLCTETCTFCCLLSSILVLINQLGPHSPLSSALIDDLLVTGLLSWVCQLSDHTMFYLGFAAAKR